jgi:hypothetical protein
VSPGPGPLGIAIGLPDQNKIAQLLAFQSVLRFASFPRQINVGA